MFSPACIWFTFRTRQPVDPSLSFPWKLPSFLGSFHRVTWSSPWPLPSIFYLPFFLSYACITQSNPSIQHSVADTQRFNEEVCPSSSLFDQFPKLLNQALPSILSRSKSYQQYSVIRVVEQVSRHCLLMSSPS